MQKHLNFQDAQALLREGDVLLFRGGGLFSFLIKRAGEGLYSHVGLASAVGTNGGKMWECVEFREWKGGRSVNLLRYLQQHNSIHIDVYRPVSVIKKIDNITYNEIDIIFNAKTLTNHMRSLTGLPYGWNRIIYIMQKKIPFLRGLYNIERSSDDDIIIDEAKGFICSTAVSYCFTKIGYDLLHNRSDLAMEPSDIARSPLLFYLFTISS